MIISDKYKYVFIELYRTRTTAISKELITNYDGQSILWKHAGYHQFAKIATEEQKLYFTFACIRNPVDRTFSLYNKIRTDHKGQFSNYKHKRFTSIKANYFYRQFKFIKKTDASFIQYLRKFCYVPYDDWSTLDHTKYNSLIKFENLNEDFLEVLDRLGVPIIRDLPQVNKTTRDSDIGDISDPKTKKIINQVFGVYLNKMGLEYPGGPGYITKPSLYQKIKYEIFHLLRVIYWRYLKKK